jgi:AraC-like DNA-binding protein
MLIGADDFITKPFRLGDLELRINNIIENRKRIVGERNASASKEEDRPLTADEEFLQRARECVRKHLSNSDFDRETFASEMGASSSTLYNKLRALTGMNISNFIRDIRMNEAKRLAESQPDIRVSDLAYMVGFKDPKYFATCFKKDFGIQPSELMNRAQEKSAAR